MLREHNTKDIRAKATGGQRANEHVGVEEDPHETSRKTSSSVRYP